MSYIEDDVLAYFVSLNIGEENVTLFCGENAKLPANVGAPGGPVAIMTIISSGGLSPERTQNAVATPAYKRPGLQLMARAMRDEDARALCHAGYDALVGFQNMTMNGTYYRDITPQQEPFPAGKDAAGRVCRAVNFLVTKRP